MVHTKFLDHGMTGFGEKLYKGFGHTCLLAWRPSWSCDRNNVYNSMSPTNGGSA